MIDKNKPETVPNLIGFEGFLSNLADSQANVIMQGNALYNAYTPNNSTFQALSTGRDFFGPNRLAPEQTTTWGAKAYSALYLENLAGRIAFTIGTSANEALSGNELGDVPIVFPDGTIKTDYTIDDYVKLNESYLNNLVGGDEILERYSLGWYNGMKPSQFLAAMGTDILRREMRDDLNRTTGSGLGDFSAVVAGSLPDPVTLFAGNALFNGLKFGVAAARGEAAVAALKASRIAKAATFAAGTTVPIGKAAAQAAVQSIGEGIAQNTVRLAGLEVFDPKDHNFDEYVDNLAFGLAIDAGRSFGWSALKYAYGRMSPAAFSKLKTKFDVKEAETKARINKTVDEAVNDETVDLAFNMAKLKEQGKTVAEMKKAELDALNDGVIIPTFVDEAPTVRKPPSVNEETVSPKAKAADDTSPTPTKTNEEGLSAQDKETLLNIAKEQAKVKAVPIDDAVAKDQLEKIANRKSQIFTYGRLDAMGLRKVKIEQPILNAFFEKVVPPEGFKLDALLAELKKAPLEVQLAAIEQGGLKEALNIFENMTKNPASAAAAVLDLAGKLGGEKADVPRPPNVHPQTFSDVNVNSVEDYMPDRSNDAILKAWNFVRTRLGLSETSTVGATVVPQIQAMLGTGMKFELSDNGLDRAIFDINSAGTAGIAMKGETGGRVKPLAPAELTKRFYREKADAAIQLGLKNSFRKFVSDNPVFDSIREAITSGIYITADELKSWQAYNEMVERMRIARLNNDSIEVVQAFDLGLLENKQYQDFVVPKLTAEQRVAKIKGLASELEGIGILPKLKRQQGLVVKLMNKLTKWMTVGEKRVLESVTAIKLNNTLTLEELDSIFVRLFNLDSERAVATDAFPDFPYKGLARFAQATFEDAETGVKTKQRFGPVTIDELKKSMDSNNKQMKQDIVDRLTTHFNNNWGGLIHNKHAEPLINLYSDANGVSKVSVSSERFLHNSHAFMFKLSLAKNINQRLKEFHVLEEKRYGGRKGSVELPFDTQIAFYQSLIRSLRKAEDDSLNITAQAFRFFTEFNEQGLDALIEYNKNVATPRLVAELVGPKDPAKLAKTISDWNQRTDHLSLYMKGRLGLLPSNAPAHLVDAGFAASHALMLGQAVVNMALEGAKLTTNAMTFPNAFEISSFTKSFMYSLKKGALSKEDAGMMLESLTTIQENIGSYIRRTHEEIAGISGFEDVPVSNREIVKGVADAWRTMVLTVSGMNKVSQIIKEAAFTKEYDAHTFGKNAIVHLAAKIALKIDNEGLSPIGATRLVAKEAGLNPIARDNLFYHFSAMANTFGNWEMDQLSNMINKLDTDIPVISIGRDNAPDLDVMLSSKSPKNMRTWLGRLLSREADAGFADFGDDYRDELFSEYFGSQSSDTGVSSLRMADAATLEKYGIAEADGIIESNPADLLKKFGRYMNYVVEQKNMNIPTAITDFTALDTKNVPFKLLTFFMRSAMAQVNNSTWGAANRGLATRIALLPIFAATGAAVIATKTYISGNEDKMYEQLDDPIGQAKFFAQVADYSGYVPPIPSIFIKTGLDYFSPNAWDRQRITNNFNAPPISAGFGFVEGMAGAGKLLFTDDELTAAQKRWVRKIFSGNLLDTTPIRGAMNGVRHLNEDGSNAAEWIDFLYESPRNR